MNIDINLIAEIIQQQLSNINVKANDETVVYDFDISTEVKKLWNGYISEDPSKILGNLEEVTYNILDSNAYSFTYGLELLVPENDVEAMKVLLKYNQTNSFENIIDLGQYGDTYTNYNLILSFQSPTVFTSMTSKRGNIVPFSLIVNAQLQRSYVNGSEFNLSMSVNGTSYVLDFEDFIISTSKSTQSGNYNSSGYIGASVVAITQTYTITGFLRSDSFCQNIIYPELFQRSKSILTRTCTLTVTDSFGTSYDINGYILISATTFKPATATMYTLNIIPTE